MSEKKKRRAFRKILWLIPLLCVGLLYLDITTVVKFSGQKWRLPSHVYARPLELYSGVGLSQEDLEWELNALGYRNVLRIDGPGQYSSHGDQVEFATRGFEFWDAAEPSRQIALNFSNPDAVQLSSIDEDSVPILRLEPLRIGGIYPDHLEDRRPVLLAEVPDLLVEGLLAVEDRSFYQHWGLSFRGILRALKADILAGEMVQGGSTITQQLVKNFYLTSDRTLWRKLRELVMAPLLELHFSKEEILETYLNEVYFGQSGKRSIRGIGLASHFYFGQPLSELDIHQMALLIGIIKGPSHYEPWSKPDRTLERRNLVLDVMQGQGLLTSEEWLRNTSKPLDVWQRPARSLNPYPSYMEMVREQLATVYKEKDLEETGLRIFTHLDPLVQRRLEEVASQELSAIERQQGLEQDTLETSAVITRVGSSEVVAMIGGREPGFDGFNRALHAQRAIGSLIKPVIYLHALQQPERSLASLVSDESFSIPAPDDTEWSPRNYDLESHGDVILLDALINSYNQATAKLGMELGVEEVIDTVRVMGVEVDWSPYPATLLGSGAMSPIDVNAVYQVFANDGFQVPASAIDSVYSISNQPLTRFRQTSTQVLDSESVHILQYALQMVMLEGTGRSAFNWLDRERRVAGKTGTTNDYRDSWFAGFGGEYLTVFWVGRDDNESMPLTGATGAMRLWAKLMADIETRPVDFVQPENVNYQWVNRSNGHLSASSCREAILLPFIAGTEPEQKDGCAQPVMPRVVDWFREILGAQP